MELRRWIRRRESYEQMRRRVVAETEVYLTECLQHPELAVRIPMIPAESGRFPRSFADAFWSEVLYE